MALGGFSKGTTIKDIADAYSCFSRLGTFSGSGFIKKITTNTGKVLYEFKPKSTKAMKEETAYMITHCLQAAAKSGTAKKVALDNISIASKTGTTNNNRDAWNASYTPEYTVVTWMGNMDSSPLSPLVKGSSYPTLISREVIKSLYGDKPSGDFEIPEGIIMASLESKDFELQKLKLSENQDTTINDSIGIFTLENLPSFTSKNDNYLLSVNIENSINHPPQLIIKSKNVDRIIISRTNNDGSEIIAEITSPDDTVSFTDKTANSNTIYSYKVAIKKGDKTVASKEIKIKTF